MASAFDGVDGFGAGVGSTGVVGVGVGSTEGTGVGVGVGVTTIGVGVGVTTTGGGVTTGGVTTTGGGVTTGGVGFGLLVIGFVTTTAVAETPSVIVNVAGTISAAPHVAPSTATGVASAKVNTAPSGSSPDATDVPSAPKVNDPLPASKSSPAGYV